MNKNYNIIYNVLMGIGNAVDKLNVGNPSKIKDSTGKNIFYNYKIEGEIGNIYLPLNSYYLGTKEILFPKGHPETEAINQTQLIFLSPIEYNNKTSWLMWSLIGAGTKEQKNIYIKPNKFYKTGEKVCEYFFGKNNDNIAIKGSMLSKNYTQINFYSEINPFSFKVPEKIEYKTFSELKKLFPKLLSKLSSSFEANNFNETESYDPYDQVNDKINKTTEDDLNRAKELKKIEPVDYVEQLTQIEKMKTSESEPEKKIELVEPKIQEKTITKTEKENLSIPENDFWNKIKPDNITKIILWILLLICVIGTLFVIFKRK